MELVCPISNITMIQAKVHKIHSNYNDVVSLESINIINPCIIVILLIGQTYNK